MGFLPLFAVAEFRLPKLCLAFGAVDCFCDVWTETVLRSSDVFCAVRSFRIVLKINFHSLFPFWGVFYICFVGILQGIGTKWAFYIGNFF
jgi:hypothetical protein